MQLPVKPGRGQPVLIAFSTIKLIFNKHVVVPYLVDTPLTEALASTSLVMLPDNGRISTIKPYKLN